MSSVSLTNTSPSSKVVEPEWGNRNSYQEKMWLSIDALGTHRNLATAVQKTIELTSKSSTFLTPIASVCQAFAAGTQLITGPLVVFNACSSGIPEAIKSLNNTSSKDEEGQVVMGTHLVNQIFYGLMGAASTASGAVATLSSSAVASIFNTSPLLSATAASTASLATGLGLGTIYLARGALMTARSFYILNYLKKYHKGFEDSLSKIDDLSLRDQDIDSLKEDFSFALDEALNYLAGTSKDNSENYEHDEKIREETFKRRVGSDLPSVPSEEATIEEKLTYLKAIDKGIYTEKLKQKISRIIGIAMIIGGIITIGACFLSGPVGIIALITAAVFFLAMEGIFLHYDSTPLFQSLRDRFYKELPRLSQAIQLAKDIALLQTNPL